MEGPPPRLSGRSAAEPDESLIRFRADWMPGAFLGGYHMKAGDGEVKEGRSGWQRSWAKRDGTFRDRARAMVQPSHRVAADGAIALRDVRPVDVFSETDKNAQ